MCLPYDPWYRGNHPQQNSGDGQKENEGPDPEEDTPDSEGAEETPTITGGPGYSLI